MSKLSLEEQVEKLDYIMGLYVTISGTDDKEIILNCLKQLSFDNLRILDNKTIKDWIINLYRGQRDDSGIAENIGYQFFKAFNKENPNFPGYLGVKLGLVILGLYSKTKEKEVIKLVQDSDIGFYEKMFLNPFFEIGGNILLDKAFAKIDINLPDEEKKILDEISDLNEIQSLFYLKEHKGLDLDKDIQGLIKKGHSTPQNSFRFSVTKYERAKGYYKKALDLCAERFKKTEEELKLKLEETVKDENILPFRLRSYKYGCFAELLSNLIPHANFLYIRQKRLYTESVSNLDQKFSLTCDLDYPKLEQLYKNLSNLQNKIFLNEESTLVPVILVEDNDFSLLAFKEYYSRLIKVLKKKRVCQQRDKLLSKVYTSYSYYTPQKFNYLNKAIALDGTNLQAIYRLAGYYEDCNDEKKAFKMWNKLIETYFGKNRKINLKKFKDATNEVGKITDESIEPFLFQPLIIKRSKKDISKEYNLMVDLYKKSPKNSVPKPISYIQHKDSYNYLIMRETERRWDEKGDEVRTLTEVMDNINKFNFDEEILEKVGAVSKEEISNHFKYLHSKNSLKKLIKLQEQFMFLNLKEKGEYFKKIKQKIKQRLDANESLTAALEFLTEKIDKQEKCFSHGDFHSGNILIKQNESILLDFEYVDYMPLLYDPIFLLEDPNLNLDYTTKEELVKYYLKEKNIVFDESWEKNIDYMSLFVNLRWAGISSKWISLTGNEEHMRMKLISLKKAESLTDKMLTYTSDTKSSNLQKLKSCLKELY